MAGIGNNFLGTWEVINCGYLDLENNKFEGITFRFRLDDNGDVTWNVPDELRTLVPLFNCETYEIYTAPPYRILIRFGAYDGHILEFESDQIEPRESFTLTCEQLCTLECTRINDLESDTIFSKPFSLLPALENGYFYDIAITSSNKKQYKVHSTILNLQASSMDWKMEPPPLADLPENVLGTILHFLYAECLPENMTDVTCRQVILATSPYACLGKLTQMCKTFLKNIALKEQIVAIVNDMHECISKIIDNFSQKSSSESLASNPSKLCMVVKTSIRDIAVVGAKLLLLCDLFTKRKTELSRAERHDIIRYAMSRLPIFFTQLTQFSQILKNIFSSMTAIQRQEVASYLVPEIEEILDTSSTFVLRVEKVLQSIIQDFTPDMTKSKPGLTFMLGKYLQTALHLRELTKLRSFHEHLTCSLVLLVHKKESFHEMSPMQKVRSIGKNFDLLIEELPIFILRLEEDKASCIDKLDWRDFKFCFKVGTSKVSGILQKIVTHRDILHDIIMQICDLVQRDAFSNSLQSLGLLPLNATLSQPNESANATKSSFTTPQANCCYKLNLVESLCQPPPSTNSLLAKNCLRLFTEEIDTDMEFEVISVAVDADGTEEAASPVESSCIIKAHRVIVAARCDWFRRALLSGMREAIQRKIVIHDTNPYLFKILLEYLYSEKLKDHALSSDQLIELLLLSDRYEVDTLKQCCEHALQRSVDVETVFYFLTLADQYNASTLKDYCLSYVCENETLTDSEGFLELPISLQVEIYDKLMAVPPSRSTPPPSPCSPSTRRKRKNIRSKSTPSSPMHRHPRNRSNEAPSIVPISNNLEECITSLKEIVGNEAPRDKLIEIILAADYDLCRAINYYYIWSNSED